MAVLTCKRQQDSNCEGECQTKDFRLRRNLRTDLLVLIKLKFLRILNFSVNPRTSDDVLKLQFYYLKIKITRYSCTWIYFNIYLCITYFIWFMTNYTMSRTCVPRKVRRSLKLRGMQRSPELFVRSTDFRVPESPAILLSV